MSLSYAVLIDGGFVKYALKESKSSPPIGAPELQRLIDRIGELPACSGMRLHRVYYYDAKPLTGKKVHPLSKGEIDFSSSPSFKIGTEQHAAFTKMPYVAMRFGELVFRGWTVSERALSRPPAQISSSDVKPNIQQKGVDMRIGLDIATLALKKQVRVVVLVTSDSDLVPAMKLGRREGMQVVLVTFGYRVLPTMYDHADVVVDAKEFCLPPADGSLPPNVQNDPGV